jgi:hypothetical protein
MQSATTQRFSMRRSPGSTGLGYFATTGGKSVSQPTIGPAGRAAPGAILNVEVLRLVETVQDEALHELAELATGAEA